MQSYGCHAGYTSSILTKHLDGQTLRLLEAASLDQAFDRKSTFRCPTPDCDFMSAFDEFAGVFRCPWCSQEACLKCQESAHPGQICRSQQQREATLMAQFTQARYFRCPRCPDSYFTSHAGNCHKMTCPKNKSHAWCGSCGKDISTNPYEHFCNLGPGLCLKVGCLHCPMFP